MPHIHTEHWSLEIPDDWQVDHDEETGSVSVSDPDDIGCLDLLVVMSDDKVDDDALQRFIHDSVVDESMSNLPALELCDMAGFSGYSLQYAADGLAWREWYLADENLILMMTYNTEKEQAGLDDSMIDQILETLVREPAEDS